jgi:hypothetical protein
VICRDNFKYEVADSSRRNGVNAHDLLALEEPKVRVVVEHTWVMGTLWSYGTQGSYGILGSYDTLGSYIALGPYGILGSHGTLESYGTLGS